VVKTSGSIYEEFLSCRTSIPEENGVRKAHEGPTSYHGAARGVAAPWWLVATSWVFSVISYFCIFSNIPKWTENIFTKILESVYLPYHIPTLF
jgi:hypothetical protein